MSFQLGFPDHGLLGVINLANEKPGTLRYADGPSSALRLADEYRRAGFTCVDLGAQSSHYAVRVMTAEEQIGLLLPIVTALVADGHAVAVETALPKVIRACAEAGAGCINLSGGVRHDDVLAALADSRMACITSFTPRDSPQDVDDVDIARDLRAQYLSGLRGNVDRLHQFGITDLIVDAGIGYSYQMPYADYRAYQVDTIRGTAEMAAAFDYPTLVAVPRIDNEWLIAAFATLAMESDASMLRCHDPAVGDVADLLGYGADR